MLIRLNHFFQEAGGPLIVSSDTNSFTDYRWRTVRTIIINHLDVFKKKIWGNFFFGLTLVAIICVNYKSQENIGYIQVSTSPHQKKLVKTFLDNIFRY